LGRKGIEVQFARQLLKFSENDFTGNGISRLDALFDFTLQCFATLLKLGEQSQCLANDIRLVRPSATGNSLIDDRLNIGRKLDGHGSYSQVICGNDEYPNSIPPVSYEQAFRAELIVEMDRIVDLPACVQQLAEL